MNAARTYSELKLSEQSSEALDADLDVEVAREVQSPLTASLDDTGEKLRTALSDHDVALIEQYGLGRLDGLWRAGIGTSAQHEYGRASIRSNASARRAVIDGARRRAAAGRGAS